MKEKYYDATGEERLSLLAAHPDEAAREGISLDAVTTTPGAEKIGIKVLDDDTFRRLDKALEKLYGNSAVSLKPAKGQDASFAKDSPRLYKGLLYVYEPLKDIGKHSGKELYHKVYDINMFGTESSMRCDITDSKKRISFRTNLENFDVKLKKEIEKATSKGSHWAIYNSYEDRSIKASDFLLTNDYENDTSSKVIPLTDDKFIHDYKINGITGEALYTVYGPDMEPEKYYMSGPLSKAEKIDDSTAEDIEEGSLTDLDELYMTEKEISDIKEFRTDFNEGARLNRLDFLDMSTNPSSEDLRQLQEMATFGLYKLSDQITEERKASGSKMQDDVSRKATGLRNTIQETYSDEIEPSSQDRGVGKSL